MDFLRASLRAKAERAIAQRSKDREFHGLEREFLYYQAQMLADYQRSKDVKHPRDLGQIRETILRRFLSESGYLPKQYGVSERSVRVVSPTGHISKEIDIALFDPKESLTLMNREDVYEVHPIESVYGVIQVKSNLSKKELTSALDNLASFKNLARPRNENLGGIRFTESTKSERGFAVLFAFTTDLDWDSITAALKDFGDKNPRHSLPNAIVVLDRGAWRYGDETGGYILNPYLERIEELKIYGQPDYDGLSLYSFYACLIMLLRHTYVWPVAVESYFRLPLISADKSYEFTYGQFAEVGVCQKHGDFARKISSENLEKIVEACSASEPVNWTKVLDAAYGHQHDEEVSRRQGGDVRVFNPENRPLSEILLVETSYGDKTFQSPSFESIRTGGMDIWLPHVYASELGLISGCPKCAQLSRTAQKTRGHRTKAPSKRNT
ncbi:conserved hypothetical protein [Agrobacterium tomkonis CFBP 6623]|uniref:DUF6602 domain-containing protein n=2 Tax=Agrobacterium TaxID=357 RepID=A0A1S7NNA5_9HYPH|nr:conserved hypothetical protein [Agrobacterium tomkonis CFBP 6623]